jgi:cytochrome b subunit of formate dehydrogenase
MSVGEKLVRWAIVIGFGLLAFVTGTAAALIVLTNQPGNVLILSLVAIASAAIAIGFHRNLKRAG